MKKAYMKGEIKRVKLVPEEAVLMWCKSNVIAGPGGWSGMCTDLMSGEDCLFMGS